MKDKANYAKAIKIVNLFQTLTRKLRNFKNEADLENQYREYFNVFW